MAHPECEKVIRDSWTQTQPLGSPMYCLFEKIKACRAHLVAWSKSAFGNTRTRLTEKQQVFEELVAQGYESNRERINILRREINELIRHEEMYWRQRSRSLWLPTGDKNTIFFHQRASQRKKKNSIEGLHDKDGVWQTDLGQITSIVEEYYADLFKAQTQRHMEGVLEAVEKVVTNDMAHSLTQPYSEDDVRRALFSMHPYKSPGPDGMTPFFFQKFWHIVGHDVTLVVLSVLHSRKYLKKMNYTHIVLIPKNNDPQNITEFRPISLGNVVSRIISKVLANRVKSILPKIISDAQNAFIPDRLITDNTMVVFEMLHRMRNRRKGRTKHMATKLDISKAKIEWSEVSLEGPCSRWAYRNNG